MHNPPLLLVEDEESDIFFLRRALGKAGISNPLHVVESGQHALDYLKGVGEFGDRARYPLPGLVLLDWKLPSVGGPDVLRWIRCESEQRLIPVIVLTSSTLASDIEEAYLLGANSYVVKPSDPEQLVTMMRDFANWWLGHNLAPT